VTIIAGFKSWEGIVLCADTQETVEHSKISTPKLIFEPREHEDGSTDDLATAFCGSSDYGPFVDKLISNAWESAQLATSLDEAAQEIEKSIKSTYQEFGRIYQRGYCPTAELIYGVKMHGSSKLFSAYGPIVNEKENYHSSGVGVHLANFIASRMYRDYLGLSQCVILAAYILFQAKEHVEGCGGESHIAVLRDDGMSGRVGWKQVDTLTQVLKESDKEVSELLFKLSDLDLTDDKIKEEAATAIDILLSLRNSHIIELRDRQEMQRILSGSPQREEDEFGFPKPSASGTSEPEQ
jgi:20S proteasome alpha/beta subunit